MNVTSMEKTAFVFLNLEENLFSQSHIRKLIIEGKELIPEYEINKNIFTFYQNLLLI